MVVYVFYVLGAMILRSRGSLQVCSTNDLIFVPHEREQQLDDLFRLGVCDELLPLFGPQQRIRCGVPDL